MTRLATLAPTGRAAVLPGTPSAVPLNVRDTASRSWPAVAEVTEGLVRRAVQQLASGGA